MVLGVKRSLILRKSSQVPSRLHFSELVNRVMIFWMGSIYIVQPSQPCSTGLRPVRREVVTAVVVAGKTVVMDFLRLRRKNESAGRERSRILVPMPSKRMTTTFLG